MSKERSLFEDSKEQTMIEAKENLRKRLALNAAAPEMLAYLKRHSPACGLCGGHPTCQRAQFSLLNARGSGKPLDSQSGGESMSTNELTTPDARPSPVGPLAELLTRSRDTPSTQGH